MTAGPTLPPSKLLLRPEDAAEMLSLSRTTLYGLLRSRVLRSVKVGGLRRIPVDALEEFVVQLSRDEGSDASADRSVDAWVDETTVLRVPDRPDDDGSFQHEGMAP